MEEFTIAPVLGRKVDVPQNDPSLFKDFGGTIATHDVGGINFDLSRKRHACTKTKGFAGWSNSANAQATKCLGLFRLDDGTNVSYCYWDNGKFFVYDGSLDPVDKTTAGQTYLLANTDLICALKLGLDVIFTGYGWEGAGGDPPQAWANGDANAVDIYSGGTEFKFRYMTYFARRLIGLYSDQANGDIDVRWSNALPTAQTDCEFAAENQAYIVNDDPIRGVGLLGRNQCLIYCEDSVNQLTYYPNYEVPFQMSTIIQKQGAANHHSIINLGTSHFLFNKNYGFCEYNGGMQFPSGGSPISSDIEEDIAGINTAFYNLIVGTYDRIKKKLVWLVPAAGATIPNQMWEFDLYTKTWSFRDYATRYIDMWAIYANYTWDDLVAELGPSADWSMAGIAAWAQYASENARLVVGGTDGELYTEGGEAFPAGTNNGYRIEPIMDFGNPKRRDLLKEIWYNSSHSSAADLHTFYRGGNTVGEVTNAAWVEQPALSLNDPGKPVIYVNHSNRLHQTKWGTDNNNELFQMPTITYKYEPQTEN